MGPNQTITAGPNEVVILKSLEIVDHSRDEQGQPRSGMLDLMKGRAGAAYGGWPTGQGQASTAEIRTATLDPFQGYAYAIRDEFPKATTVLDAFHAGPARQASRGRGPPPRATGHLGAPGSNQ